MELRQYWVILRRHWLIAIIPALIVLALGLVTYQPPLPAYNAGVRFIVGQSPGAEATTSDQERYYNWLGSEYIVNGLADWIRGGKFAEAVSEYLASQGIGMPPGAIQGGLAADNARSMLTVSLTGGDPLMVEQMMGGVIVVLTEQNAQALPQLGGEQAILTQLDDPVVNPISAGLRNQLDLPLRIALSLIAGIGLALLAHYLDPTVRDRTELEAMGILIIGEIPGEGLRKKQSAAWADGTDSD
jgi:capsular polysaccharide biosynthesis protein